MYSTPKTRKIVLPLILLKCNFVKQTRGVRNSLPVKNARNATVLLTKHAHNRTQHNLTNLRLKSAEKVIDDPSGTQEIFSLPHLLRNAFFSWRNYSRPKHTFLSQFSILRCEVRTGKARISILLAFIPAFVRDVICASRRPDGLLSVFLLISLYNVDSPTTRELARRLYLFDSLPHLKP